MQNIIDENSLGMLPHGYRSYRTKTQVLCYTQKRQIEIPSIITESETNIILYQRVLFKMNYLYIYKISRI